MEQEMVPHPLLPSLMAPLVHLILTLLTLMLSPVILLFSPLLLFFVLVNFSINLLRASQWKLLQLFKLSSIVAQHAIFIGRHLSLMLSIGFYYFWISSTDHVKKNIYFTAEHKLDVYMHADVDVEDRAVIIFVFGGAWSSGKRWYYSRLANIIRHHCNVVVVVTEYPLYPSSDIQTMVRVLRVATQWTQRNIARYGGSVDKIWMLGHSSGAHLIALLLVKEYFTAGISQHAVREAPQQHSLSLFACCWKTPRATGSRSEWKKEGIGPSCDAEVVPLNTIRVKGCILFNGVYDLKHHRHWEVQRGVALVSGMTGAV